METNITNESGRAITGCALEIEMLGTVCRKAIIKK